jgi:D-glycerate 3-kinase
LSKARLDGRSPAFLSGLSDLAVAERLPPDFPDKAVALWQPHLGAILARRAATPDLLVVGLCGPQGSGKSTTAKALALMLADAGPRTAVLGLDDLYLGRADRQRLADTVHPLLITRGPPGTHDVAAGIDLIDRLGAPGRAALPRFDKARDDRADPVSWPVVDGPIDVLILEGWCVGARPQPEAALIAPANALEAERDADGRWRRYVNHRLADDYAKLFVRIGYLILLRPPSFEVVTGWRIEQEHKLRDRSPGGRTMDDDAVARFVQHYERISRHLDAEMPARADLVIQLDARRNASTRTSRSDS